MVGTGILGAGHITLETLALLEDAEKLFYLVSDPVTETWLRDLNHAAESLHDSYREGKLRSLTYAEMEERILAPVRRGQRVCAAFYGHPGVFATSPHRVVGRAREEGYSARMLPGISAEDCLFADLGVDPATSGWRSYEATDFLLRRLPVDTGAGLILWQIGLIGVRTFRSPSAQRRRGLEVLSLALRRDYPDPHRVTLYEAAQLAVCEPRIESVPLAELPESSVSLASTLWVPPLRSILPERG